MDGTVIERKIPVHKERCGTRRMFATKELAEAFADKKGTMLVFNCSKCGAWHLTSKDL